MNHLRRAVALLLVTLATPSLFWVCFSPITNSPTWGSGEELVRWFSELFFVVCFAVAAVAVWRQGRYWPSILLLIVGYQTYATAGRFMRLILIEPSQWGYFKIVLREAEGRGFNGGLELVWALIVLPVGLPLLFLVSLWLFAANHRASHRSEI